jgi:polyketide synthase PksL
LKAEFGQFILHPSIIDGALQTVAGLVGSQTPRTPHLPFSVDEVDLIGPVPQTCYVYAERADALTKNHASVARFNIRLLNESGDVMIRFKTLYVRPLAAPLAARHALAAAQPAARGRLVSPPGESIE